MSSDKIDGKESSTLNEAKKKQSNEVHSANKWEEADLGDDDRKKKFLRLMGASKKEHRGKIVIGDHDKPHERGKELKEIDEELEEQYIEALEHKKVSGFKGHTGLGFHQEQEKEEEKKCEEGVKEASEEEHKDKEPEDKAVDNQNTEKADKEKECQKHKLKENADEKKEEASDPKKKKFMMNFVKASS